jgi:hypothetical protein
VCPKTRDESKGTYVKMAFTSIEMHLNIRAIDDNEVAWMGMDASIRLISGV